MPFFCDVCGTAEGSYESWLLHVTTQGHQEGLRLLGGEVLDEILSPGVRERVLVAHDVPTWVPLIDVAQFFSFYGQLRNVVYRGNYEGDLSRMRVLVVFDSEAGVDAVINFGPIVLGGVGVDVERLYTPELGAPPPVREFAEDIPIEAVAFGGGSVVGYGGSHYDDGSSGGIPSLFDVDVGAASYQDGHSNNNNNFYDDVKVDAGADFYAAAAAENNNYNSGQYDEVDYIHSGSSYHEAELPVRLSGAARRKLKRAMDKNKKRFRSGGSGNSFLQEVKIFDQHQPELKIYSSSSSSNSNKSRLRNSDSVEIRIDGRNGETVSVNSPTIEFNEEEGNEGGIQREGYLIACRQMGDDMEGLKVEEQVESFCGLFPLSASKRNERDGIAEELKFLLSKRFSNCDIHLVGNDALEIATHLDELIICVDPFGKLAEEFFPDDDEPIPSCQAHLLSDIFEILKKQQYQLKFCKDLQLKKCSWVFSGEDDDSDNDTLEKITFVHRGTETKVVLLLEHFIVLQESRFIKFLCSLDLRVQPLMCFVRCFSSVFGFFETSTTKEPFPDHSILWILVFFLISKKILPSVLHLQNLSNKSLVLNNTDVSFNCIPSNIEFKTNPVIKDRGMRALSLLSILQEFFEFFGGADLRRNVICPAIGKLVPLKAFGKELGGEFPKELITRYLFTYDGCRRRYGFYAGSPLGLQDPFFLNTNLTKDVSYEGLSRFQDYCNRAAVKLSEILEGGGGLVTDIFTNLLEEPLLVRQPGLKRKWDGESDDEDCDKEDLKNTAAAAALPAIKQKTDSPWEIDTEDEDFDEKLLMSFQNIRKSKIRMNQTLRKYFENAMSRILPQLLDDLYRDSIVEDVVEELVSYVEEELESEQESISREDFRPVDENQIGDINMESNGGEEKVLVDNEFKKVVEDEDGDIFVIKKKNLNQMSQAEVEESSDDDGAGAAERDEDEKHRRLHVTTRRKFQILWVQFLKEFNSIFWTECFGFELESPPDADWRLPEYAVVIKSRESSDKKTLKQRWAEIPETPDSVADIKNLGFRCVSPNEITDILYKKKVWKPKFFTTQLKSLWSIVSGKADAQPHEYDENIERVRLKTEVPFERRLEFSGALEVTFDLREEIPPKGVLGTRATLRLTDEAYGSSGKGLRAKKLRFLAALYERLAMKYVNVRVKQWLGSCSDFQAESFNVAFKRYRRNRQGHPKWRKFKKKWKALGMV